LEGVSPWFTAEWVWNPCRSTPVFIGYSRRHSYLCPHTITGSVDMTVRNSIFGSNSESELFASLKTRWADKGLDLYPSIPFAQLINLKELGLGEKERDFLYKTSVDYTFCERGKPLLSVDFDGMGYGFSRGCEYVELKPQKDPNRKLKFDSKLRVSQKAGYPYFVVSFPEKQQLAANLTVAIVDGIIGQVFANRQVHATIQERVDEEIEWIHALPEDEQHEVIQDIVTGVEVEAGIEWDPVEREAATLEGIAWEKGLVKRYSWSYLEDPPRPPNTEVSWTLEPEKLGEALQNYLEHQKYVMKIGCKVVLETDRGPVAQTCWMRNIEGCGASPLVIVENIAKLLAFKKVVDASEERVRQRQDSIRVQN